MNPQMNYLTSIDSGKKQENKIIHKISKLYKTENEQGKGRFVKHSYRDCICAFDIETTRLPEIEQSIMYLWQFAVLYNGNEIDCVYGRDWDSCERFFKRIEDEHLVTLVFVHNLSYEFQFLRSHLNISSDSVMALKPRKILKFLAGEHNEQGNFEFRCSYLQTHKSLDKFLSDSGVENQKLKDYDYDKRRYPWTELSQYELEYGCNDVIGLVQAMHKRMVDNNDSLYSLPLTSTGYVRRKARQAMKSYNYKKLHSMMCDVGLYTLLREEFRGGDTHANRYFVGQILENVASFDRSSSYPDVMLNCEFPMSKFTRQGKVYMDDLNRWKKFHKAFIGRFHFKNIRQKDVYYGSPYLTKDKGYNFTDGVWDNGRLLESPEYSCTLNDIDFDIVTNEYEWDSVELTDFYTASYRKLPEELRTLIKELFTDKTSLKGVDGKEKEYALAKELINSLYGMSAQNPVKPDILYTNTDVPFAVEDGNIEEKLSKYNKRAFMLYAWGCWVTAWARQRLKLAINIAGEDFVYSDTDSCKIRITERYPEIKKKFDELNETLRNDSINSGGYANDKKGVTHYLGVYEYEGTADRFITLGAKKYALEKNGKLEITIAGVNKKLGAEELAEIGGLEALKIGTVFKKAGGTESVYNDCDYGLYAPDPLNPQKMVDITRNVVIRPSEYTVGLTMEYLNVINNVDLWHDFLKMTEEKSKKLLTK